MRTLSRSTTSLAPNRYEEADFSPRLSFEIPAGGTWVAPQFVEGFFDIQQDPESLDVIAVQFCRPAAVHGASGGSVAAGSVAEAITALRSNSELAVGETAAVAIAGRQGLCIDLDTTAPRLSDQPILTPVLWVAAGPISLASARRLRINWLDLADGPLAVLVGGSIAQWQRTLAEAEPVLASLRIEAGDQAIAADRSLT